MDREQGVSKAGNKRLRTMMIQVAWLWLRHQPESELTLWYADRVQANGGRIRRVMIVALARKLLIALWQFSSAGVVPKGRCSKLLEQTSYTSSCRASSLPDARWTDRSRLLA